MLTFFHRVDRINDINANLFNETYNKLHQAIRKTFPDKVSRGVILLDDNARSHVAKVRGNLGREKRREHPPYIADLSPRGPLKRALEGCRLQAD